jgi:cytochrome oxidase Cu insertion factor (SCO1/SenC/PrrC family)
MLRWLATAGMGVLLILDFWLPSSGLARRGSEATVRADVADALVQVGDRLPPLELLDLEGRPLALADFRGHPLLLTFERSVDW